jgi:hypothetical protein
VNSTRRPPYDPTRTQDATPQGHGGYPGSLVNVSRLRNTFTAQVEGLLSHTAVMVLNRTVPPVIVKVPVPFAPLRSLSMR